MKKLKLYEEIKIKIKIYYKALRIDTNNETI